MVKAVILSMPGAVTPSGFAGNETPAAPSVHAVAIEAPAELGRLLQANLEIVMWADSPRMNNAFFARLFNRTEQDIRMLLATEGYFSPSIESSLVEDEGLMEAQFRVEPGKPGIVSSVDIRYSGEITRRADSLPKTERTSENWALPKDSTFRQSDWERAKRELLREFMRYNYPAARIEKSKAHADPETGEVDISVVVDSGPFFTLGDLLISGLVRYPEAVVLNRNFIKPGTPHNKATLFALQELLVDSGYFDRVIVSVEADPDMPQNTPVLVTVEEKKSKSFGAGASINSNTGPGGRIEYSDINFTGRGWRWKNRIEADMARQAAGSELSFLPDRRGNIYGSFGSIAREDIGGLESETLKLGVSRTRKLTERGFSTTLHFHEEKRRAAGVSDTLQAVILDNMWTVDRVDSRLYPSSGHIARFRLGGAFKEIASDSSFLRASFHGRLYHSLSESDILIFGGEAGAVLAGKRDKIPSEYLFRTGGINTVRGYPYQWLGVRENGSVTGGRYMGVFSMEYNRWLRQNFALAVFSDWGNAADSIADAAPRHGYGAGLRFRSPVGIIQVDFAYGEARGKVEWHLSAGMPF